MSQENLQYPFSETEDEFNDPLSHSSPLPIATRRHSNAPAAIHTAFKNSPIPTEYIDTAVTPNIDDDSDDQIDVPLWGLESLAIELVIKAGYLRKKGQTRKVYSYLQNHH